MGVDLFACLQQVSIRMHQHKTRREIETVLDEMEYLFEVIPPDDQDTTEQFISLLRQELDNAVSSCREEWSGYFLIKPYSCD